MTRWLLRWMLVPLAAFTAAMSLIRVQPYDDPELRALFAADGCPMPCFMDIQPGVTQVAEAIRILEHHDWIGNIEPHYIADGTAVLHLRGWLFWDWNNRAPDWLKATSRAALGHAGALTTLDGVVDAVMLATRIPFGRLRVLYGEPDGYSLSLRDLVLTGGVFSSATLYYEHTYLQRNMEIEATTPCQQLTSLWFNPTAVTVFSEARKSSVMSNFFRDRPFLEQTVNLRKLLCNS